MLIVSCRDTCFEARGSCRWASGCHHIGRKCIIERSVQEILHPPQMANIVSAHLPPLVHSSMPLSLCHQKQNNYKNM